jgi:hypothetical protein
MADERNSRSTRHLICPSCRRSAGSGPNGTGTVVYMGITWCERCARMGRNGARVYVQQPSPGRMVEGSSVSLLDTWTDCLQTKPKRRMRVSEAKAEIRRAWELWDEDKNATMAMMMFFGWLQENRPLFLTFRSKGDPWQDVHCWLLEYERDHNGKSLSPRVRLRSINS